MTILLSLALRSSVILAAGLLVSASLKRRSAALRHRVLVAALVGAAAVLPLSLALPEWNVLVPATVSYDNVRAAPAPTNVAIASAAVVAEPRAPESPSPAVIVWLAGLVIAGGMLIVGLVRVSRIAARATPLVDPHWVQGLEAVAMRYGLTRPIAISRTDSEDLLAMWGALQPQLLVPHHADTWPLDRVHVVLSHELAHVRRHDWLVQLSAEILRAVLWFNPVMWLVCARLRRESEQACDDEVLALGVEGSSYASHLIELVRLCRRRSVPWLSAVPMAHPSTLERRIAAMLNPRLDRRTPSRRVLATLAVALLFVTLPVAALRGRQAGPAPLLGTIYDVTGGVMPGVQVTLVDANDSKWAVTSAASGRFEFPPVQAGKYVLEVALPGFRTLRQEFQLRDAGDWDRAVTLQVGDLKETVTVRESRSTLPKQLKATGAASQPIRIGGNIRAPRKEVDVRPVYPVAMREAGLTGVVPVEAIIGRDGTVSSVRVLSAQVHPAFVMAAVDAVRQWRFSPTLLNGVAVEVVMTVSVRFDLED